MSDDNKHNLHYFEASSMRELFASMQEWQNQNKKRLLSLNVEKDADKFCCIALTNPTEVIILDRYRSGGVDVRDHALKTFS